MNDEIKTEEAVLAADTVLSKKWPSTLGEWEVEVERADGIDLIRRYNAIAELASWPAFHGAFGWTSYKTLAITIWYALDKRGLTSGLKRCF